VTRRRIILAVAVVVVVGGILVLGATQMPPGVISVVVSGRTSDTSTLGDRAAEFGDAFADRQFDKVYRLFNSDFRDEVTEMQLDRTLNLWLAGRNVRRVSTTHIEVKGLSGLVSSNIYFNESAPGAGPAKIPEFEYLFQSWIRTAEGWQLLWLNKVLDPIALDYGHRDTAALQEILQLALDEIITGTGLEQKLGISSGSAPIVLLVHGASDRVVSLSGRKVLWLSREEILAQQRQLGISFYIDVQPIRVLKHLAIGTFDIISLPQGNARPQRTRSIKLFFVRDSEHGKWEFADYGAKW
jgi:hypothetical protein